MSPILAASLLLLVPVQRDLGSPAQRLHPHLARTLEDAARSDRLTVYFVMEDRPDGIELLRDARSARVARGRRLGREARRERLVLDLKDRMDRSQRGLMDHLRGERAGDLRLVHRNWVGNLLVVEGTPDAIRRAAAVNGVAEVWLDEPRPLSELEDGAPMPPSPAPPNPVVGVGNGPLDTRANEVWAKGIDGSGIVWMNADSGVRASHTDLASMHPGLAGRLWTNPGEVFDNGIDDDGNGRVDDYYGWNFLHDDNVLEDYGGHGSATAGVFVAREGEVELGNCPGTRIMTGRIGTEAAQWAAVQYAIEMGAHGQTSSHSWKNNFNPPPNYRMHREVGEVSLAAGLIRTNSTSNNGTSCTTEGSALARPFNVSAPGCLPPPWLHPDQALEGGIGGVLGIGAHMLGIEMIYPYSPCGPFAWSLDDLRAVRSYTLPWDAAHDDYPWTGGTQMALIKPDLTGPQGTRSISGMTNFGSFAGTSNGTPSVASCLALALSANPSLGPEDMAMAAQTTAVDMDDPGKDNRWGAGRVDAWELTKMARNLMRVNGSVAHTVRVSVATDGVLSVELDGIPDAPLWIARGGDRASVRTGELEVRVANPQVFTSGRTDAQGDFAWEIPLTPSMIGAEGWLQVAIRDPDFGPFTGSNAIHVIIDP